MHNFHRDIYFDIFHILYSHCDNCCIYIIDYQDALALDPHNKAIIEEIKKLKMDVVSCKMLAIS